MGLFSRHDRNSIGAADSFALGLLAESHRTATFNKWELGWSCLAKHESDSRRAMSKTGLLPWSVLYSQFTAKLPPDPDRTITRRSVLWGLAFSQTKDSGREQHLNILPAGILFHRQINQYGAGTYVLGTGISSSKPTSFGRNKTRFRLFGIPIWTR